MTSNSHGHHHHGHGHHHHHDDNDCVPCFGKGTALEMSDGSFKKVEEIEVGDVLATVQSGTSKVLWVGSSVTDEYLYRLYDEDGTYFVATQNHGVAVNMLDGSTKLAPMKFLEYSSTHADFFAARIAGGNNEVYHVMLEHHDLVTAYPNIISESYFCGGYSTKQDAMDAYVAEGYVAPMNLALPRLKKKDMDEVVSLKKT